MIHFTCDRCKRAIDPETETRYVVEIDVRMVSIAEPKDDPVEDLDQLAELHDQLQRELHAELGASIESKLDQLDEFAFAGGIEDGPEPDEGPEQYDLCEQCHEIFANNPLGREATVGFGFSNN